MHVYLFVDEEVDRKLDFAIRQDVRTDLLECVG